MKNRLAEFRRKSGLTQADVAERLGVKQPTYQRWESNQASVPSSKMELLESIFDTTVSVLRGDPLPVTASDSDDKLLEEHQFYGSAAFHFCGGGAPLYVEISEAAKNRLFQSLHDASDFIWFESLNNQTVIVRRAAVEDVFISSWANEEFAPEGDYKFVSLRVPEPRDWSIITAIETGYEDDYADPDRVEQLRALLAEKSDEEQEAIFALAYDLVYQTSSGKKRVIKEFDEADLASTFYYFFLSGEFDRSNSSIVLQPEGYDSILAINQNSVDYISIPTNRLRSGEERNMEEE